MAITTLNGSDPSIYLTNGTRIALGLQGPSARPRSVVQAAQDAYNTANGAWFYVEGMPNTPTVVKKTRSATKEKA